MCVITNCWLLLFCRYISYTDLCSGSSSPDIFILNYVLELCEFFVSIYVSTESDQLVNICSFIVRCDRRWPSTQWHRVYTGSGNVPYVQFGSVSDFILEPRCSKFAVGLQTRRRKMGCTRGPVGSGRKGQEWQELRYELSVQACAWGPNPVVLWLWASELDRCWLTKEDPPFWERAHPLL